MLEEERAEPPEQKSDCRIEPPDENDERAQLPDEPPDENDERSWVMGGEGEVSRGGYF